MSEELLQHGLLAYQNGLDGREEGVNAQDRP